MAEPLFFVDLSEEARDYRHTALEPGLPVLDRQGMNFSILKKWLGDYVAEPEWRGPDTIAFFLREEGRGRLEDVDCQPCTKADLEKTFEEDLNTIRAKIKKAKPESSTEQLVHRILKKVVAEQTNDLENSDFNSYFFKCRAGNEPWRLVWCVGYQRADLEPLKAKLWSTKQGDFLGVRPPLQGGRVKKRKRVNPVAAVVTSPLFLIFLLALLIAFLFFNRPQLVVSPVEWKGPLGSRVEFKLVDHRWFFFKKDVTDKALGISDDKRVVTFDKHGLVANAKSIGRTGATFQIAGRAPIAVIMEVTEPLPPDSLTIEIADGSLTDDAVNLAVGSTQQLKAIGHYAEGNDVDLTTQVSWWEDVGEGGSALLAFHDSKEGLIQADGLGSSRVMARYPIPRDDDTYAESSVTVKVVNAKYVSLAVALQPATLAVGQSSRIDVRGIDEDGAQHALTGSSLLSYKVDPTNIARLDGDYLVGAAEGSGQLKVAYDSLEKSLSFVVSGKFVDDDFFAVRPSSITNAVVHEMIPLNVTTGLDDPITAVSADTTVVDVLMTEDENAGYEVWLAARAVGETEVTVSQAGRSAQVQVIVTDGSIESMAFSPPAISLTVPVEKNANLRAVVDDGRTVRVAPDVLKWLKQPRVENVYVDKRTLVLKPLEPTSIPQDLEVRLADTDLVARATVEVKGGDLLALMDVDGEFGVHPPVPARGRYIHAGSYLGDNALYFDDTLGGLVVDRNVDAFGPLGSLPAGSVITGLNGRSLLDMNEAELAAYLRDNPIIAGDAIRYRNADGAVGTMLLGGRPGVVVDVKLLDVTSANIAADSFEAELSFYLRQGGEYRLTDAAGSALTQWQALPPDATPIITAQVTRNAADDYELYLERRIGDEVRRFQVPFKLENQRRAPVSTTTVLEGPDATIVPDRTTVIERGTDRVIEGTGSRTITVDRGGRKTVIEIDRDGGGRREIRVDRNSSDGGSASIDRGGSRSISVDGSSGGGDTRINISGAGQPGLAAPDGRGLSGTNGDPTNGDPTNGNSPTGDRPSASPSGTSPTPNANPNSPTSPSPANSPQPNPNSPSPNSPSPNSPSPSSPTPTPSSPASPNSPSPNSPSPNSPSPNSPSPNSPSPNSPSPNSPSPNSPNANPQNPNPVSPASAYDDAAVPSKPTGNPADNPFRKRDPRGVAGKAEMIGPVGKTETPLLAPRYGSSELGDDEGTGSPLLEGLKRFRDERKKRENITGQGRIPVIKSTAEERAKKIEEKEKEKAPPKKEPAEKDKQPKPAPKN